eukprot:scaffold111354_cov27-Tisochrysis_lutea.AAC.1
MREGSTESESAPSMFDETNATEMRGGESPVCAPKLVLHLAGAGGGREGTGTSGCSFSLARRVSWCEVSQVSSVARRRRVAGCRAVAGGVARGSFGAPRVGSLKRETQSNRRRREGE